MTGGISAQTLQALRRQISDAAGVDAEESLDVARLPVAATADIPVPGEPPVGTVVEDCDGDRWVRDQYGWLPYQPTPAEADMIERAVNEIGASRAHIPWGYLARCWGPVTAVPVP